MHDERVLEATVAHGDPGQSWAVPLDLLKELFLN